MELPRSNAKNSTNMEEQNKKSMPQFRIKEPCPKAVKPKSTSNQQPAIAVDEEKNFADNNSENQPKTYNIHIDGEEIADNLPNQNGVYFVLSTRHSSKRDQTIQYIGQANREQGGIADRAEEHKEEGYPKNMKYAYSILDEGNYTDEDYFRIEYALIFALKPEWNGNGDKHYNYGKTTINISGNCPWIRYKHFTIENDKITVN